MCPHICTAQTMCAHDRYRSVEGPRFTPLKFLQGKPALGIWAQCNEIVHGALKLHLRERAQSNTWQLVRPRKTSTQGQEG